MKSTLTAVAAVMAAALVVPLAGQAPKAFPGLDVRAPVQPRPFVAAGATYLAYELHITNLSSRVTTIDAIEVRDRAALPSALPLLRLERAPLEAALYRPGASGDPAQKRTLAAGQTAFAFVWVALRTSVAPASLTHRFEVRMASPPPPPSAGPSYAAPAPSEDALTIRGVEIPVSKKPAPIVGPPLEGDLWLAANGPDNDVGHRRTLLALAGEARIAQRFATDWVRLFEDGRTFRGDPLSNESYRAFGARVLAVADGTVVDTVDRIPENVPDPVARAVQITPATLGGNSILLQIGDEIYATYAHLQPGSLRVTKGARVRKGQVLALVGNTGNSSEPHLHFQLADAAKAFDAEGIPYALAAFDVEAAPAQVTPAIREVGGTLGIDPAALAAWLKVPTRRRERELPLLNTILSFGDSQTGR